MSAQPRPPRENGEGNDQPRQIWYRRRPVVVSVGIVIVLTIAVISDLPVHGSPSANISAGRSVMIEVNNDIASCAFGAKESFNIHQEQIAGSLSSLGSAKRRRCCETTWPRVRSAMTTSFSFPASRSLDPQLAVGSATWSTLPPCGPPLTRLARSQTCRVCSLILTPKPRFATSRNGKPRWPLTELRPSAT